MKRLPLALALLSTAFLVAPSEAFAYVGPGAGLSAFGALVGFVAAIFVGIFGFIWYPIKRLLRALKPSEEADEMTEADSTSR